MEDQKQEKDGKEGKPKKQLLLRAVYSDTGQGMRLDVQKSMMTPQEAIGILEIAKNQLMKELSHNQMTVRQEGQDSQ
ncbi:hypothetical protein KY335_03300 [Candidatus Woesearchaeota archaeon]|nr:hypothetical protein [Candidatus Woesearchaeota archaeon]MBW3014243.1 hypothetical protein [Candidatus Woesearchaeota archaeon]